MSCSPYAMSKPSSPMTRRSCCDIGPSARQKPKGEYYGSAPRHRSSIGIWSTAVSNTTLQPTVSVVLPARERGPNPRCAALRTLEPGALRAVGSDCRRQRIHRRHRRDLGSVGRSPAVDARRHLRAARGANSARNVGVRAARAERILFCDSDDVVTSGWVRELSRALDDWDLVGGVTETAMLNDIARAALAARIPCPTHSATRSGPCRTPSARTWDSGAGCSTRSADSTRRFSWGPTRSTSRWRAQYAGFRLGFAPEAVVQYRLKSRPTDAMRQAYVFARGDAQLYAKHRGLGRLPRPSAGTADARCRAPPTAAGSR